MKRGDPYEYDRVAEQVFTPAFPTIAGLIREKYGRDDGICLDIGAGGGHLGIALARITCLDVVLLDNQPTALEIADKRIASCGLSPRITTLLGNAANIPAPDRSYDLAISRGSIWFWDDQAGGLAEAYRVLKPGGMAYIGSGFGSGEVAQGIIEKMKTFDPNWFGFQKSLREEHPHEKFLPMLEAAGVKNPEFINNDGGFWMVFKKDRNGGTE